MYTEEKSMVLKSSTSALGNNLSILVNLEKKQINYAVVHKSVVNVVSAHMDGSTVNHRQVVWKDPSTTIACGMVLQARLLTTSSITLLVIAAQRGIQIYEADGSVLLHYHTLEDEKQSEGGSSFARGIAACGDVVIVGDNRGNLLCFLVAPRGNNVRMLNICKGHNSPVTYIDSSGDTVASADDNGDVIIWRKTEGNTLESQIRLKGQGYPCTSVKVWENIVVTSYGSGQIRVWTIPDGRPQIEVAAHAKWINGLDLSIANGMVLSVGEDSFARIWKITPSSPPTIEHVWTTSIANLQLQGGAFLTPDARAFGVTGYDSNEVFFYKR